MSNIDESKQSHQNFELFMGCLGNGVTVCNKAVLEHGDYKKIAHISNAGNIKWYVETTKIPGDALLRIEHNAHTMESNFMAWFDNLPAIKQYEYLLNRATVSEMLDVANASLSIEEKISMLKSIIIPRL